MNAVSTESPVLCNAMRPAIQDVSPEQLRSVLESAAYPSFRYRQVLTWLERGITDLAWMTDLPKDLKTCLEQHFSFDSVILLERQRSQDRETEKYLLQLADGQKVEMVSMLYRHGHSVCISSQVGCRMGCRFCASAQAGFGRQLLASEMLMQIHLAARERKRRVDSVVVMGIGEPFDNYDELLRFIRRAHEAEGVGIGYRHFTISTCGLVPEIERLAAEGLPVSLAISLHAPDDALRRALMPIARRWSIDELMLACRHYLAQTKRRLTYEYALFKGINDHLEQADALADLLKGQLCHVNLIPGNPVPGQAELQRSPAEQIERFRQRLERRHISVTCRRSLGADIEAACGQLRRQHEEQKSKPWRETADAITREQQTRQIRPRKASSHPPKRQGSEKPIRKSRTSGAAYHDMKARTAPPRSKARRSKVRRAVP